MKKYENVMIAIALLSSTAQAVTIATEMPYIPSVKEQTRLAQLPDKYGDHDPRAVGNTRGYTSSVTIKNNVVFVSDNEDPNKYIFKVTLSNTLTLGDGPVYSDRTYYKSVLAGDHNTFLLREVKYRKGVSGHSGDLWRSSIAWADGKFTGSTSKWTDAGWRIGADNGSFFVENEDGGWAEFYVSKWMDSEGHRVGGRASGSVAINIDEENLKWCIYHNGARKGCIDYAYGLR